MGKAEKQKDLYSNTFLVKHVNKVVICLLFALWLFARLFNIHNMNGKTFCEQIFTDN